MCNFRQDDAEVIQPVCCCYCVTRGMITNCPCQLLSITHLLCVVLCLSLICNLNLGHMFCCMGKRKTHSSWTNSSYSKRASGRSCTLHILFWQGYCRQCSLVALYISCPHIGFKIKLVNFTFFLSDILWLQHCSPPSPSV